MELLVIGKPNTGKTLLLLNLAQYLGMREICIDVGDLDGALKTKRISLDRARRDLVSLYTPKTTQLQTMTWEMAIGRQRNALVVTDSPGILEGIHPDADYRRQLALTLERATRVMAVFHVVDASATGTRRPEAPGTFDVALAEWAASQPGYLLVANKVDKPGGLEGLRLLRERFPGTPLVPASAVTRRGFRELKGWIVRVLG